MDTSPPLNARCVPATVVRCSGTRVGDWKGNPIDSRSNRRAATGDPARQESVLHGETNELAGSRVARTATEIARGMKPAAEGLGGASRAASEHRGILGDDPERHFRGIDVGRRYAAVGTVRGWHAACRSTSGSCGRACLRCRRIVHMTPIWTKLLPQNINVDRCIPRMPRAGDIG